jgi:hypothetical protein
MAACTHNRTCSEGLAVRCLDCGRVIARLQPLPLHDHAGDCARRFHGMAECTCGEAEAVMRRRW